VGSDHQVIGKVGRLTGEIAPCRMGEVMSPIRGGAEAYFAYAADPAESLPRGTLFFVIERRPPRTVIVSRIA